MTKKRKLTFLKNLNWKTKLIASFLLIGCIPYAISSTLFYNYTTEQILSSSKETYLSNLNQNVKFVDKELNTIMDNAYRISFDSIIYDIIVKDEPYMKSVLLDNNKIIGNQLFLYFDNSLIYSTHIYTDYYMYYSRDDLPINDKLFKDTEIYNMAIKSNNNIVYKETYEFSDMYSIEPLDNIDYEYKYLFSITRVLDSKKVVNSNILELPNNFKSPILLINFKLDIFDLYFVNNEAQNHNYYCVVDENGKIISHTNKEKVLTQLDSKWLESAKKNTTGTIIIEEDSKQKLYCYDKIKSTGWYVASVSELDSLLYEVNNAQRYILIMVIVILIVSILMALYLSNSLTKPISLLVKAFKATTDDNFPQVELVDGNDEIYYLFKHYNEMNERIQTLIEERHVAQILDKEAHISAINSQLNPHFLYNTLSTINYLAIKNKQEDISNMLVRLSSMLQYSTKNTRDLVCFSNDFEWLKNYIFIMQKRFNDKFKFSYEIDEISSNCKVPKLFFQPFVENSIKHGFDNINYQGKIHITGEYKDGYCEYTITDNGKGMDPFLVKDILDGYAGSIGTQKTIQRIKLLFTNKSSVDIKSDIGKGTEIIIKIPSTENI